MVQGCTQQSTEEAAPSFPPATTTVLSEPGLLTHPHPLLLSRPYFQEWIKYMRCHSQVPLPTLVPSLTPEGRRRTLQEQLLPTLSLSNSRPTGTMGPQEVQTCVFGGNRSNHKKRIKDENGL